MQIIPGAGSYTYIADSGDWRLSIGGGLFAILPQVGGYDYASGITVTNLGEKV
jgi:hypothetical protein